MMIEVLGPVRLRHSDTTPIEVPERKVRLALAAFVADRGPLTADALIERLWPETKPADPRRVLRAKLSQLRSVLETAEVGGRERLQHRAGSYTLAVDDDQIDAQRFRAVVAASAGATNGIAPTGSWPPADVVQQIERLREALGWWRGDAYGDLADEAWLMTEIAGLTEMRLKATDQLAEALLSTDPDTAAQLTQATLAAHPTRERSAGIAMQADYRRGNAQRSLATFAAVQSALAEEFGADPSPALSKLHQQVLRHDPALTANGDGTPQQTVVTGHVATTSVAQARGGLPVETSPFVGRDTELSDLAELVKTSRLVTVTGLGGVGKTRLAMQTARAVAGEDATWFVDLTELRALEQANHDPMTTDRVAKLVATSTGMPTSPGDDPDLTMRLAARFGPTQSLLVLDNAEHVVADVARFLAEILPRAGGLRVLVTSRQRLGLPAEQLYALTPLPTSPGPREKHHTIDDIAPGSAPDFFLHKARATVPNFTVAPSDVDALLQLCRRLDGLPLALELAAAQLDTFSIHDLLTRVSDRLQLLTRPGHGAPRRQQTLRGMLDWSWSLLDEEEKTLLRRLAVHDLSWSLPAIEGVCCLGEDKAQVSRTLARLVDRSLVSVRPDGTTRRYRLLESVAAYAAEQLEVAGERDQIATGHIEYIKDLVACADHCIHGPEQRAWLNVLHTERGHIRRAFDEAVARDDGASAVALLFYSVDYRRMTGRTAGMAEELAAAVACSGPRDVLHAQASVLALVSDDALLRTMPVDEFVAKVDAALAVFDPNDEAQVSARANVLAPAGLSYLMIGRFEAGLAMIEEAVEQLLADGRDGQAALQVSIRDWIVIDQWDQPPRGMPDGRDPEAILREWGHDYGVTQAQSVKHLIALKDGDRAYADEIAQQALALSLDLHLSAEASYWVVIEAITIARAGARMEAKRRLDDARQLARDASYTCGFAFVDLAEQVIANDGGDLPPLCDHNEETAERRWVARLVS